MHQQNFKLNDFRVQTKTCQTIEQCKSSSGCARIANAQSQQMQMRVGRLGSRNIGSNPLQVGCNLSQLPSNCSALTCNSQPRKSPNQLQSVSGDQFQASSPNNLAGSGSMLQPTVSSIPSPGYWNQYGGQESGVNALVDSFHRECPMLHHVARFVDKPSLFSAIRVIDRLGIEIPPALCFFSRIPVTIHLVATRYEFRVQVAVVATVLR